MDPKQGDAAARQGVCEDGSHDDDLPKLAEAFAEVDTDEDGEQFQAPITPGWECLGHPRLTQAIQERRNLLHLCIGRQQLELELQHLMYSLGLIDYFDDRIVTRLQAWMRSCLAPGGRSILGHFHPNNPTRGLMDHLLDWRLNSS